MDDDVLVERVPRFEEYRTLRQHALPGAFIGLMAASGVADFYKPFGFIERPSPGYGPGMFLIWPPFQESISSASAARNGPAPETALP